GMTCDSSGETSGTITWGSNLVTSYGIGLVEVGCGSGRFWVGGTGNWSDTTKWSDASNGTTGCVAPTSVNAVTVDAASCTAACTITVDVAATMASYTDSGFNDASSSLSVGANNWTNSGAETHSTSNLPETLTTSTVSITGTLTLSGGSISFGTSSGTATVAAVNVSAT